MTVKILSTQEKQKIWEMHAAGGYTQTDLAHLFSVSPRTIARVLDEEDSLLMAMNHFDNPQENFDFDDINPIDPFWLLQILWKKVKGIITKQFS